MRIIGGYAAGLQLKSPPDGVKPTMDRVREAVFSSLEPIEGLCIVDLFAGSGALGFEAFSRAAGQVAWFEQDPARVKALKENLEKLKDFIDDEDHGEHKVFCGDILSAAKILSHWKPDIILADPPYNPLDHEKGSYELLQNSEFQDWAKDALVVMEQSKHNPLDPSCLDYWDIIRHKKYGNQLVYYFRLKSDG
ncbi:MAG: RsmD family RNA methyltransferase [Lentisphaeria bacterium]|nr:RsmD family RNA methyltransferase [Lentisphaeria bacterium]NQZ69848.1 RsmD family RNA methyltransferase [Lentisphaeria bacterium]